MFRNRGRVTRRLMIIFLLIEFMDEFVYSLREAAWPLIRDDLALSYSEIGLILSLPALVGVLADVAVGLWASRGYRRVLLLGGGLCFTLATALVAGADGFIVLLLASILSGVGSGAFVNLAQVSLMAADPQRREQNMARWTFAGSVGVVAGAIVIAIGVDWRLGFSLLALGMLLATALAWHWRAGQQAPRDEDDQVGWEGIRRALRQAIRQFETWRWIILLEMSDLILDVLYGFLALYLVDVAGADAGQASLGVLIWVGVGLIGDLLIIPVLERVPGLVYLRLSALVMIALFPAFLLAEPLALRFALLGAMGFVNAGWYSILQAHFYDAIGDHSDLILVVESISVPIHAAIPIMIGLVAESAGLGVAMWLLWLGPVAVAVGLPRRARVATAE